MNRGKIITNISSKVMLVLGVLYLMYIIWSIAEYRIVEKNNSCLLGIRNAFEENQYVYANIDAISGKIVTFNYFEGYDFRIGIDESGNAVVMLANSEKLLKALKQRSVSEQDGSVTIYGYSAKLPQKFKQAVISTLNDIVEYDEITEENIDSYIGEYYLMVGENDSYFSFIINKISRIVICIGVISVGVLLALGSNCLQGKKKNYAGLVGAIFGTLVGGSVWILNDGISDDSLLAIFPCLCGYLAYWIFMEKNSIKVTVIAHAISNILMILCCIFIEFQRFYIAINNQLPGHFSVSATGFAFWKNIVNGKISYDVFTHILSTVVVSVTIGFVIGVCAFVDIHMREWLRILHIDEESYKDGKY